MNESFSFSTVMSDTLLVLSNHMFVEVIKTYVKTHSTIKNVILYEEPLFFRRQNVKPNQVKIAYLRASMRFLHDQLREDFMNVADVTYVEFHSPLKLPNGGCVSMFDPVDHTIRKKYKVKGVEIIETPSFIASIELLREYKKNVASHKRYHHAHFYAFMKERFGVLRGVPNLDVMNRERPSSHQQEEDIQTWYRDTRIKYYDEAKEYVRRYFADHIGSTEKVICYPICRTDALQALDVFLKRRFNKFGKYQDAIVADSVVMYHSFLSACINIGLLLPSEVIKVATKYYVSHKKDVQLNDYEGFVRQVIGWREYMRFLYEFHYRDMLSSNSFGSTNKLSLKWYDGSTGIAPVDNEIRKALEYGYSHHIVRLMIFLNTMIMTKVHPRYIYKWFMEVVAIDAYDWVMVPNIYAMGYFWRKATRKPYVSSSNYILRMSDYKRGEWSGIFDDLYRTFVATKPDSMYIRV